MNTNQISDSLDSRYSRPVFLLYQRSSALLFIKFFSAHERFIAAAEGGCAPQRFSFWLRPATLRKSAARSTFCHIRVHL